MKRKKHKQKNNKERKLEMATLQTASISFKTLAVKGCMQ